MIIIRLIGGLGNQLFQYAFARSLAISNNYDFKIDISEFEHYKLHNYSLNHFNIIENIATESDIEKYNFKIYKWVNRIHLLDNIIPLNKRSIVYERKPFEYDEKLLNVSNDTYIIGYFQNEKYFKNIRNVLINDFKIKNDIYGENGMIADKIKRSNSVSIHIRRGDYINNENTNNIHGTCNLNYYKKSMDMINKKISNPTYFVFSDDIKWAKSNIVTAKDLFFIDNNNASTNYEDLRLMSLCKINIIANSTFSWWSAWLNNNPNKLVIAPKRWFKDPQKNKMSLNIVPKSWYRI